MDYLLNNKEWIFSGIGVLVLSLIITFIFRKKGEIAQTQKSGKNSTNTQGAGDIRISLGREKDEGNAE